MRMQKRQVGWTELSEPVPRYRSRGVAQGRSWQTAVKWSDETEEVALRPFELKIVARCHGWRLARREAVAIDLCVACDLLRDFDRGGTRNQFNKELGKRAIFSSRRKLPTIMANKNRRIWIASPSLPSGRIMHAREKFLLMGGRLSSAWWKAAVRRAPTTAELGAAVADSVDARTADYLVEAAWRRLPAQVQDRALSFSGLFHGAFAGIFQAWRRVAKRGMVFVEGA